MNGMPSNSTPNSIVFPYEFDTEKRRLSKLYLKQKLLLSLVNGFLIPISFFVLLLFTGLNVFLQNFAQALTPTPLLAIPFFVLVFQILLTLIEFPLTFYSSYVFEHKYKLSNYTLKTWFKDYIKELFLDFLIAIPLLSLIFYLVGVFPLWWLGVAILLIAFSIVMDFIYPIIIFPFFYKTEPYPDEHQRDRLLSMVKSVGVSNIHRVMLARESEKSKKPNAFFSGFGKTKTIVLFDTLTNYFTPDETETVVAHELGHYVHKDSIRFLILEFVLLVPSLFLLNYILHSSIGLFGITSLSDLALFPLLFLTSELIQFVLGPLTNAYSRHRELLADQFALNVSRKPFAQISTEKRLSDMALLDHNPPYWLEWIFFTHPSAQKRINLCADWAKQNNVSV